VSALGKSLKDLGRVSKFWKEFLELKKNFQRLQKRFVKLGKTLKDFEGLGKN
tara:strand:- start:370 stop:525 length:156 start_codon:yes stop_codon:yes gene_type:complete